LQASGWCDSEFRPAPITAPPLAPVAADDAILDKLSRYVLDPAIIEGAIADAVQEPQPSNADVERKRLQTELRRIEEEQARFVEAIAVAGNVAPSPAHCRTASTSERGCFTNLAH
jgi:hypothetical protein